MFHFKNTDCENDENLIGVFVLGMGSDPNHDSIKTQKHSVTQDSENLQLNTESWSQTKEKIPKFPHYFSSVSNLNSDRRHKTVLFLKMKLKNELILLNYVPCILI